MKYLLKMCDWLDTNETAFDRFRFILCLIQIPLGIYIYYYANQMLSAPEFVWNEDSGGFMFLLGCYFFCFLSNLLEFFIGFLMGQVWNIWKKRNEDNSYRCID